MRERLRLAALSAGAVLMFSAGFAMTSISAVAQENYEIQVYPYETVAPRNTMVELHSNYTVSGTKAAPGSRHGYHSMTFGYLVGEVVRRVSRRSVGRFFREEVAEPLGVDCHIGFGPEHDQRVAELTTPWPATLEQKQRWATMFADPASMLSLAVMNPPVSPGATQTRAWRAAEIPAVNGHGTAHGLARLFGALASDGTIEGVRLLSPEAIRRAVAERSRGLDAVLARHPEQTADVNVKPGDGRRKRRCGGDLKRLGCTLRHHVDRECLSCAPAAAVVCD